MNKKIVIILLILAVCILLAGPVAAKQKVKIKISSEDSLIYDKGYITMKLVDKKGHEIRSNGMINYTVTDKYGNYKWTYKAYKNGIREKYEIGKYKVKVKFFGDSKYKKAKKTKQIKVKKGKFDAYTYYEDHNWGLDQEVDDYFDYHYWGDEIYDDVDDPENEAWDI